MKNYKLSNFCHIYKIKSKVILYHSLLLKEVYSKKMIIKILRDLKSRNGNININDIIKKYHNNKFVKKTIKELIKNKLLIPSNYNENDLLNNMRKKILNSKPTIHTMYLIPTNDCNFRCKYCHIENFQLSNKSLEMSEETAKKAIDLFARLAKLAKSQKKYKIIFYGGEPLLKWDIVKNSIPYARLKEKEGVFGKKGLQIVIVTNGSLLTDDMAKFFKKFGISVGVSLDGNKKQNDSMRIYKSGKGTWKDVVRAINILKNYDIKTAISCTIHSKNVNILPKVGKYFCEKFKIESISFNLLKGISKKHPSYVSYPRATKKLLETFEVLRKEGIYEDRIMRKIISFVEEVPLLNDCLAASGKQIAVSPNGDIGPCHVALLRNDFIIGNLKDKGLIKKILSVDTWKKWRMNSPIFFEECKNCEALGICGGGCPYDAYLTNKIFPSVDYNFCSHSKIVLDWMIKDLLKIATGNDNG